MKANDYIDKIKYDINDMIDDFAIHAMKNHKYNIGDYVRYSFPSVNRIDFGEICYFYTGINGIIYYIIDPLGMHNKEFVREEQILEKTKDPRIELKTKK